MNNKPIRVAQIIGKWVGGGVEVVIMNYYRHIDRSKIQFDFICDSDSTNIPYEEIKQLGGKVIIIPSYKKIFKYSKELIKILKENKYDIVHSNINTLSVFSLRCAKKAGVKVRIAHSHSTSNKKEWKRNIIKNILRPFSKVYATNYFACSQLTGRWLFGNKTFDQGKVQIINNAIELDKFKFNEEIRKKLRKELNIDKDIIVIGHVGRFVQTKNHQFIVSMFKQYNIENPNSILLLIGQGPLEEKIKKQVNDLHLSNKVIFLGQRDDINNLYQAMDIFVLPSLYEGLGMVLVEAQAAGLPCIASTKVSDEVKLSNNFNFIDLNDSYTLWCDNIDRLISKSNRNELINSKINNKYEICNEKTKLISIYIDLISK